MPSLNSDSPASCAWMFFGTPTLCSISRTAIGSVGEISVPKNRHSIQGAAMPRRGRVSA